MNIYGYVRVSSIDQNEDRQLHAMREFNIPQRHIYIDKVSGKDFNRTNYQKLFKRLKSGDLLYIKDIKRLGRNYEEIQNNWRTITKEKCVDVVVIDTPLLDTRMYKDLIGTFISDLVLQILSFEAQKEREDIRKSQAEGIKAARLRGVHLGRPVIKPPENFLEVVTEWERGKLSTKEILAVTGLTENTFYRRYRELKAKS